MTKKIALDARILTNRNRAGIERYTYNVCRELLSPAEGEENQTTYFVGNIPDEGFFCDAPQIALDLPLSDCLAADKMLSLTLDLERCDLLFSPYYPVPQRRTFKAVLTIHDLIALRQGELFPSPRSVGFFDREIRVASRHADQIIAVSEATKRDVMDYFDIPEDKISVIYEAADPVFVQRADQTAPPDLRVKHKSDQPYILSVCTLEPRKNLARMIQAYDLLRQRFPADQPLLVLVGKIGWKVDGILSAIQESPFRDDIVLTGYLPDEDLPSIYRGAELFVYPSLLEGFGLPVLEAMTCGTPVITSNTSSLPEVGGDAVCYCDPRSIDSIADAMESLLFSSEKRADLTQRGKKRAARFSWRRTAEQMRRLFDQLLD